ncbi:MAG: hypothetical protein OXE78_10775 [Gammaproteobacteria bacterium]|nr:hypothetical protein [Gammaproteobacteria bacterium]
MKNGNWVTGCGDEEQMSASVAILLTRANTTDSLFTAPLQAAGLAISTQPVDY